MIWPIDAMRPSVFLRWPAAERFSALCLRAPTDDDLAFRIAGKNNAEMVYKVEI